MSATRTLRGAVTGLLVMLFALLAARDIDRPFYGLHSWDAALAAWAARTHVHYGLGYTKGLTTLAVGDPPPATPPRYLDHPQLHVLLDAASMALLGVNEVSLRLTALVVTALCLPFLVALLRRVFDDETALLAVFFYIVFPVTIFFNASCWVHWVLPFALIAYWCYLTLIGGMRDAAPPGARHLVGLGVALFVLPQLTWFAAFYCAAIVSDYALRCAVERRAPERRLLSVLVLGSLAGALADLGVLLAGRSGDLRGLAGVYAKRFHAFGGADRTVLKWLGVQWETLRGDFTLPIVLLAGVYLAYRAYINIASRFGPDHAPASGEESRPFSHAWLFSVPGIAVLVFFPELFWLHQMEYSWLALPVALAAALGSLRLRDVLRVRWGERAANGALLAVAAAVTGFAAAGLNDYYSIRWRAPAEIEMFKTLNKAIAPDQALLTYYDYFVQEFADKPGLYRPEVAWYLDRPMSVARSMKEVEDRAATGLYPFYLVDLSMAPPELVQRLKARYPSEFVRGNPYRAEPHEIYPYPDQLIFDLEQPSGGPMSLELGADGLMKLGLDALYRAGAAKQAARYFRRVLEENPDHLGANFQIAKALDIAGEPAAAAAYWTKTLELARRYGDAETEAAAAARLARGR